MWLGGLLALGAIVAPIVFAVAPFPQNADAMTLVFRRFDTVAMTCAAVVLASEAARAWSGRARQTATLGDALRAAALTLAAAAAVFAEGSRGTAARIAAPPRAGRAARTSDAARGKKLLLAATRAELSGKAQVLLLAFALVLEASGTSGAIRGGPVDSRSSEP